MKKASLHSSLIKTGLLCSASIFGTATTAWAQADDSTSYPYANIQLLQNVVITGQYKATQAADAIQRVRVIDAKKIAAMGAQNLRDVLLNEMNVSIAQDNVLGSSVQIQGVSGQNVKLLIDGIPVIGRQDGNIDISQLNVYNVERIELIEGPMSVNYGTDALAGTINIITKSSVKNKLEAGINTYTETIGKYNMNAHAGYQSGKHSFILSGSRNFFDGWDEKESNAFLNFKAHVADSSRSLQWDPKEEYNVNFQYQFQKKQNSIRFKSDYFYDIITNRGNPSGYYANTAFDDYYRTSRFNNAILANGKIFRHNNYSFIAAYNQYKRVKNTYEKNLNTLDEIRSTASDQDTAQYSLLNSRATITAANAAQAVHYEIGYDINIERGSGKRILEGQQSISDYALYASTEFKIVPSLLVRTGLRYAYNTAFSTKPIPSLQLKYNWHKDLSLRASYASGFRSPTVKELYFEFKDSNHDIVGNPNLQPEASNNYAIALSYTTKLAGMNVQLEVASFLNQINNMINLAQPDTNLLRYTYINVDHFKTKGIQFNLNGRYKNLNWTMGSSYIGRYNQLSEESNAVASSFSYAPEFRCNTNYEIPKYGLSFALFFKYTGAVPSYALDTDGNIGLSKVAAYGIADCSISKKLFQQRLSISVGCKNISNTTNIGRTGVAANSNTAHATSSNTVSIGTGRSYFLGMGYQFSKK